MSEEPIFPRAKNKVKLELRKSGTRASFSMPRSTFVDRASGGLKSGIRWIDVPTTSRLDKKQENSVTVIVESSF